MARTREGGLLLIALECCGACLLLAGRSSAQSSTSPAVPGAVAAPSQVLLRVRLKGSGAPVNRAEVTLPDGKKEFTNKQGELKIAIPAGAGQLRVYRSGQEPEVLELADLRGKDSYDLFLLPATPSDNEVVVRGERRPEASRKTVTIAEAVKVAPGGDPAQVPRLLPGVQSQTFSPDIVVRGSGPNDSLYRIDNFDVPFIFHRIGNLSVIPDQLLTDVEFSTGGFGAQFGNVTGGVVTLHTKNDVPEQRKFEFRVNLPIYSSLYYEQPVNDGKDLVAASVRRSYLDAFLPTLLKKAGAETTVIPFFGDEHLYYYHPTDDGHLKLLATHAYDGLHAIFNSSASTTSDGKATFDFKTSFELIGVEWKKALDKDWTLTMAPSVASNDNVINIVDNNIDVAVRAVSLHTEVSRRLGGKDRLYLGNEVAYGLAKVYVQAPIPNDDDPFYDPQTAPKRTVSEAVPFTAVTGWLALDEYFGDLMLTPGVRPFYYSQMKKGGYDPRFNWRYQLNKEHALKGAIGQYSETPQFQDTDKTFGNPDLKYIRAYHYVLGVESNWTDLWLTDFQLFYKEINDLVRSDPVTTKNNNGKLISAGFEAFIRRNLTERLFGWIAYTYSRNREQEGPGEHFHNGQYDQTHVLNLVGNYKLTSVWDAGGRLVMHTGDTYTGVDHSVYDADLNKYERREGVGTPLYGQRLPFYHELDIYADRDVLYDTWKLTWRFGVEYAALQRQAQGVRYNYDYTKTEYFRNVPPIPYLELRGVL